MSNNPELPPISSETPEKGVGKIQEVYSSAIDGVPNGKDNDIEGYAFGKQPVQPIDEEAEAIDDDGKPIRKKNETGIKDQSSFLSEDQALMNGEEDGTSKDNNKSVGSPIDLDLFSYNSASLTQYDQKNPDSKGWRVKKIAVCAIFVVLVSLLVIIVIATGSLSNIGKIKSTRYFEEVESKQEFPFNKDTLPIHHVVTIGQKKQDLIHQFCANGEKKFCKGRRRLNQDFQALFSALDTNADTQLQLNEFSVALKTKAPGISEEDIQAEFNKADTDASSGISYEEYIQVVDERKQLFDSTDTNQDGSVTLDEFSVQYKRLDPAVQDPKVQEVFTTGDIDANSQLSFDEFKAVLDSIKQTSSNVDPMTALFKVADSDNNGKISLEEWKVGYKQTDPSATEQQMQELYDNINAGGDGIGEEDFKTALKAKWQEMINSDPKLKAFSVIDVAPNDFRILIDEWKSYRQKQSATITEEQAESEFKQVDIDSSQSISESEFKEAYDTLQQNSVFVDPIQTLFDAEDNDPQDQQLSLAEFTIGFKKQSPTSTDPQINSIFTQADSDQNTFLTFEEFKIALTTQPAAAPTQQYGVFVTADLNSDSQLDRTEYQDYQKAVGLQEITRIPEQFDEVDTKKSNRISLAEFESNVKTEQQFKDADTDGDGLASKEEMQAYVTANNINLDVERLFQLADKNTDSKISKYEVNKYKTIEALFNQADTNGDSKVSKSELSLVDKIKGLRHFFDTFDTDGDKSLDMAEFSKLYFVETANPNPVGKKCTVVQEDESDYLERLTECSSATSCYDEGYKNDKCNDWESCASIHADNVYEGCFLSKLCGRSDVTYKSLTLVKPVNCKVVKESPEMKLEREEKEKEEALKRKLQSDPTFALFYSLDSSDPKDQLITYVDWSTKQKELTPGVSEEALQKAFADADLNTDQSLDYQEFTLLVENAKKKAALDERLKDPQYALFYSTDQNTDDILSFLEWSVLAKNVNPDATEQDLQTLFDGADGDGDTNLTFSEFIILTEKLKKQTELDEKLKDSEFALFYSMDSEPKDELLTYVEWSTGQKLITPGASEESLQNEFSGADGNSDQSLTFDEFKILRANQNAQAELELKLTDPIYVRFHSYDLEPKDDKLTVDEFLQGIKPLHPNWSEEEIKNEFAEVDDSDGLLTFDEFKQILELEKKQIELQQKLTNDPSYALFYEADTDKNDQLTLEEFTPKAKELGFTEQEIKTEFDKDDTIDPKGSLDIDEYKILVQNLQKLVELNKKIEENPAYGNFYLLDAEPKDDLITYEDWSAAEKQAGTSMVDGDLKNLFDISDVNPKDGSLSFEEYETLLENQKQKAELDKKLEDPDYAIFHLADESKDDSLIFDELLAWLKKEDTNTLPGEAQKEFDAADTTDPKGVMNLDEFKVFLSNKIQKAELLKKLLENEDYALFYSADINPKNEFLSLDEWKVEAKKISAASVDEDIEKQFNEVDSDQNGQLDFDEFKVLLSNAVSQAELQKKLQDPIFALFYNGDLNEPKNELLSYDEFKAVYKSSQNTNANEVEFDKYFKQGDKDSSETLTFDEFKNLYSEIQEKEAFIQEKLKDPTFALFYAADTTDPKDEKLDLNEYSVKYKETADSQATEEFLTSVFTEADSDGDTYLVYEEFENSLTIAKRKIDEAPVDPVRVLFNKADTSQDQKVQFEEFKIEYINTDPTVTEQFITKVFTSADLDNNAELLFDEFKTALENAQKFAEQRVKSPNEVLFEAADVNQDGGLAIEEWISKYKDLAPEADEQMLKDVFTEADQDSNTVLSLEEFIQALAIAKKKVEDAQVPIADPVKVLFDSADTEDPKGLLTPEEYIAVMVKAEPTITEENLYKQFDAADLNKDNKLIYEEFSTAVEKAKELAKTQDPDVILFNSLDTEDPKGELSINEWNLEIKKAKPDVEEEVLIKLFNEVDTDSNNSINIDEFKTGIENARKRAQEVVQIKDPQQVLFDLIDIDDPKGQLSYEEWSIELKKANPTAIETDLQAQFQDGDLDDDGFLTFEEYQALIAKVKKALEEAKNDPVRQVFDAADTSDPKQELSFEEYKTYIMTSQPESDEDKLQDHFAKSDTDQTQSLSFEEFKLAIEKAKEELELTDPNKILFKTIDTSKDRLLSLEEWKVGMKLGNKDLTDEDLEALFQSGDKDLSDSLSFEEFQELLLLAKKKAEENQQANTDPLKALFDQADTDETKGELSFDEYSAYATNADNSLTATQIKAQYDRADSDTSYSVSLQEFKIYLENAQKAAKETDPLKKLFILSDIADPKDELSYDEWSALELRENPALTEEILKPLFAEADKDGSESLNFEEYKAQIEAAKLKAEEAQQAISDPIKTLFNDADINPKDELLTLEEYSAYYKALDPSVEDPTLQKQYQTADIDSSSSITFAEFKLYVDNVQKASEEADPLKKLFIFADTQDPKDSLDLAEWSKEMSKSNPALTEQDLQASFTAADVDANGSLDFNEFKEKLEADQAAGTVDPERILFDNADSNSDGDVVYEEFKAIALTTNPDASEDQLKALFKQVDSDQNEKLSFEEFKTAIEIAKELVKEAGALADPTQALFNAIDTNQDGSLDLTEYTTEIKKNFPNALDDNIKAIFDEADADVSSSLNLEEFKQSEEIAKKKQEEAATVVTDPAEILFNGADLNKDGSLTQDEYVTATKITEVDLNEDELKALFTSSDQNQDQLLSLDEYKLAIENAKKAIEEAGALSDPQQILFNQIDTNADGSIDLTEFSVAAKLQNPNSKDEDVKDVFTKADEDISSTLNLDEFKKSIQIALQKQEEAAQIDQQLSDPQKLLFVEADTNQDGNLSEDEWSAYVLKQFPANTPEKTKQMFKIADTTSDSLISLDEFKQFLDNAQKIAEEAASALADPEKVYFDNIDTDSDGQLSYDEYLVEYNKLKPGEDERIMKEQFTLADEDNNDFFSLYEYKQFKINVEKKAQEQAGAIADEEKLIFDATDINVKDGFLTYEEFQTEAVKQFPTATEQQLKEQFANADSIEKDEKLSLEEFREFVKNLQKLKDEILLSDPEAIMYQQADVNSDQALSLDEWKIAGKQKFPLATEEQLEFYFTDADSSEDGTISLTEFKEFTVKAQQQGKDQGSALGDTDKILFTSADSDSDGKLSFDEFKAKANEIRKDATDPILQKLFTDGDSNQDTFLDLPEFRALSKIAQQQAQQPDYSQDALWGLFKQGDANNDNQLSQDEWTTGYLILDSSAQTSVIQQIFTEGDENVDGQLQFLEFKNAIEIAQEKSESAPKEQYQVLYDEVNTIKDDGIDETEFTTYYKANIDADIDTNYLTSIFTEANTDGIEKLTYEEFKIALEKIKQDSDQGPKDPIQGVFDAADTSPQDTLLSIDEFLEAYRKYIPGISEEDRQKIVYKSFTTADTDSVKNLSFEEFKVALEAVKTEYDSANVKESTVVFNGLDVNPADDGISIPELKAGFAKIKADIGDEEITAEHIKYDLNKNGKLEFEEFKSLYQCNIKGNCETDPQGTSGETETPVVSEKQKELLDPILAMFKPFDTDEDGLITYAEYSTGMKKSYPYSEEELQSLFNQLDKDNNGDFSLYKDVPVAQDVPSGGTGIGLNAEQVTKSQIRDQICNNFEGYLEQKIDGDVESKFELECNLFTDENGNYVLHHSFYKDDSKYGGKQFKTKRSPGSGHRVVFKPLKGVKDLQIASQTMVHSKENLSLQDSKKAFAGEGVQPLFRSGGYNLGSQKPSEVKLRFRNEKKMVDGKEKSGLQIYETAGETSVDKSYTPSTSRRRLSTNGQNTEEDNHNIRFEFDHTVKKFEVVYFTMGDSIGELGGSLCIIFIVFYLLWWLISLKTSYSFFTNMVEMISRKYNEASEWKQIQKLMAKFRKIHIAMCNLHQFKEIINEIEAFQKLDFDTLTYAQTTETLVKMKILDQKLPNIDDIEVQFSKFEMSEAEKARSAEIDAIIERRCHMSFSDILTQIRDRVSFFGIYNLYDEIEMNDTQLRAEIKIQNAKLEFLYQALAQRRRNTKKKQKGD